jgi:hypothetical protein
LSGGNVAARPCQIHHHQLLLSESERESAVSVNVICMKWGRKYGPEYVNTLKRMVARNLERDHRFICFTDDGEGLETGIEVLPLPSIRLPNRPETEAWRKLALFQPGLAIAGPTLFLDLDVVILSSLEPFFEQPGSFNIIHNWTHLDRRVGNSSVFRFVPGENHEPFQRFDADPESIASCYANEQVFLSECIDKSGELNWWPAQWCRSFKKHCLPKGLNKLFKSSLPPKGCRIVVFHGNPNPPEAASSWRYRGQKRWRIPKFKRPARWIFDYWY